MYGVYHCPILYIAHHTGCSIEGASKGLQRLIDGGYCTYDHDTETVFVHEMARFQIGESLKRGDKRVYGTIAELDRMPKGVIREGFRRRYGAAYHLPPPSQSDEFQASPLEAPSQPLRSQEQEKEKEREKEQEKKSTAIAVPKESAAPPQADPMPSAQPTPSAPLPAIATPKARARQPTRIPSDWSPTEKDLAFAESRGFDVVRAMEISDQFRDHYLASSGKGSTSPDWEAKWRTWIGNEVKYAAERAERGPRSNGGARRNGVAGDYEAHQRLYRQRGGDQQPAPHHEPDEIDRILGIGEPR
jgi:hypothetical protein